MSFPQPHASLRPCRPNPNPAPFNGNSRMSQGQVKRVHIIRGTARSLKKRRVYIGEQNHEIRLGGGSKRERQQPHGEHHQQHQLVQLPLCRVRSAGTRDPLDLGSTLSLAETATTWTGMQIGADTGTRLCYPQ